MRALAAWALLALPAWAGNDVNDAVWRIWLEPIAMHAPVTQEIPNARRTEWTAGFMTDEGPVYLTKREFAAMGMTWDQFASHARRNAGADLRGVKIRYQRNRDKVIEYAEMKSDRPVLAGSPLAPQFLDLWKDTLGDKVIAVIPNRFTAYIFPALAGEYQDYAPMVIAAYRETAWPVSMEAFEVSTDGVRAVGLYHEP